MLVEKEQRVLEAKDDFIEKQINRKSLETLKENKFMKLKKKKIEKSKLKMMNLPYMHI
ncbi:hypothetical protein H477_2880 [[Clostridium] sordellii ATCC 9714]|nr:hypothetical protein H477_2880 [[Clostridium] sordellii ATCC 9714] [Paeniclostridium sordellii ATCC 9714]